MTFYRATEVMKESNGFTLIEAMVAVTILTLAVTGPLFTASRATVAAEIVQDQLTASYLAQEGIEYTRAMRDDEYLLAYAAGGSNISSTAWNDFLSTSMSSHSGNVSACRSPAVCTLDMSRSVGTGSGLALEPCPGGTCSPLYLRGDGVYTQQSIGATIQPYTRTVQIVDVPGTSDAPGAPYPDKRIVSTVTWTFHGIPYSITITDHLTPWQ